MSDANGVRRSGNQRAPRVIHLPSPRRLLKPEPALLVAGLALVGAMNAPVGVATTGGGVPEAASTTQVTGAPDVGSLHWFDEAQRRERGDRLRAVYAVPLGPAAAPTPAQVVGPVASLASFRVPDALWAAYTAAADAMPSSCNLDPRLLAAIGQVESGSLAGRGLDSRHRAVPGVFGPVLDGGTYASIPDTDNGRWDGDRTWDRAVGPMQFIPSTWAGHGRDADGDGVADPQDIEDAALSAAGYLCAGGRDLSQAGDLRAAILSYNHSQSYLATVLGLLSGVAPGGGVLPARDGRPDTEPPPVVAAPALAPTPTAQPSTSTSSAPSGPATTAATSGTASPTDSPTSSPTSSTASPSSSSSTSTTSTSTTSTSSPTSTATSSTTTASPTPTTTASPTATTTTTSSTTTSSTSTSSTTTSSTTTSSTTTPSPTTSTPEECPTPTSTGTASATGTTSVTGTATATSSSSTATPTGTCTAEPTATATPSPSTSSANAAEKALDDASAES